MVVVVAVQRGRGGDDLRRGGQGLLFNLFSRLVPSGFLPRRGRVVLWILRQKGV